MRTLSLCDSCKRHIRAQESVCPFCGAPHGQVVIHESVGLRGRPGGRAALFLAGVAVTTGCEKEEDPMAQPVYGIPIDGLPYTDGGAAQPDGGATTLDTDEPMAQPVYGVAIDAGSIPVDVEPPVKPRPDAGTKGGKSDAGKPTKPVPVPVYGIPIDFKSDAGNKADDGGAEDDPIAVPIYGIPVDVE